MKVGDSVVCITEYNTTRCNHIPPKIGHIYTISKIDKVNCEHGIMLTEICNKCMFTATGWKVVDFVDTLPHIGYTHVTEIGNTLIDNLTKQLFN